ncbi:energy-coupling factor transporter transmembrane component T family protein [Eggerthella lenta]|uniref:energy-coupling factor transporter transmembrane component T family protein n=1 Tax=Eggerthella lenta TaxID=84112 RepID=UPI003DA3E4C6
MANFKDIPDFTPSATLRSAGAAAAGAPEAPAAPACAAASARRAGARRRLDPRTSLAVLLMLNLIAFAPTKPWTEVAAVGLCAATMLWCGRASAALRWLAAYAAVFGASMAVVAFPNEVTASFAAMIVVFRRVFCVGMFASNMIATTRVGEMASALQRAHVPRGGVVALCVALRFFPTMGKEFSSVAEAMKVRGVALSPATVLRHPALTAENLMVPVMSRLAIVADELSNAAIVRGIDSAAARTSYYELRFGLSDTLFAALFGTVVACVALIKLGVIA